jgi:hypothetical protein
MQATILNDQLQLTMSRDEFSILFQHVSLGHAALFKEKDPHADNQEAAKQKKISKGIIERLSNFIAW